MTAPQCVGSVAADCDNFDVLPVRRGLRPDVQIYCAKCRAAMTRAGAQFRVVERRVAAVPVAEDRRRTFIAPWRRHLAARDETGRMLA